MELISKQEVIDLINKKINYEQTVDSYDSEAKIDGYSLLSEIENVDNIIIGIDMGLNDFNESYGGEINKFLERQLLKQCPFCDGDAKLVNEIVRKNEKSFIECHIECIGFGTAMAYVTCTKQGIDYIDKAIDMWNKRV